MFGAPGAGGGVSPAGMTPTVRVAIAAISSGGRLVADDE